MKRLAVFIIVILMAFTTLVPCFAQEDLRETEPVYSVMSPLGSSAIEMIKQAPRLDSLAGKRIAIVGRSFNATVTQEALKEMIMKDYPDATVYTVNDIGCGGIFSVFDQSKQSKEFQQKLVEYKIDAVISGNCGCGLCTVKESGSSIAAEYIGIPTVTVGATSFIAEIHSTGTNRGVPVLRTVEYPGAFSSDSLEQLSQKSRDIIYPGVVKALTMPISHEEISSYANEGYRAYDDVIVSGTYDMIQTYYRMNDWSDGLPVILPTKEKVEEYLKYTPYSGGDILGIYPLAYREVRVYTVAVNAIMAGCPPEYMPLCIAFVKTMDNPDWRRPLASTHGWSPYAWINGPVARQIGISNDSSMMNNENNKKFARFIDFAMKNLGGYYIKENRMGSFGYLSPWFFSEDEEACLEVGWNPYHVTKGMKLNDNVLTSTSALYWGNDLTLSTEDPQEIMQTVAFDITEKQQNGLGNTKPQVYRTMYITKDIAQKLSAEYKTKTDFENSLISTALRPMWLRTYAHYWANTGSYQYNRRTIERQYQMLVKDEAEKAQKTAVPDWYKSLLPNKDEIMTIPTMLKGQTPMLVVGDDSASRVQIIPGGGYKSIEIELPENWDTLMASKGYRPLSDYYLKVGTAPKKENTAPNTSKGMKFKDVSTEDWFYKATLYVTKKGFMKGISEDIFGHSEKLTRGMFAAALYRMENEPSCSENIFADVENGSYYENAIAWAYDNKIVNGTTNTTFSPDEYITREQIAVIMHRYLQYKNLAMAEKLEKTLDYSDRMEISDYATEGVIFCTEKGIMKGKENNNFAPRNSITRAELATILYRVNESIK